MLHVIRDSERRNLIFHSSPVLNARDAEKSVAAYTSAYVYTYTSPQVQAFVIVLESTTWPVPRSAFSPSLSPHAL